MRVRLFAFTALLLASCSKSGTTGMMQSAAAPIVASRQCSAPEFRQLDFWVGVWDVRWDGSASQPAGDGINTITHQLGKCVIQEHFEGGPSTNNLIGHSVSTYHASPRLWRQTWVDNQGGYFALTGGPTNDGKFVLENTRLREEAPYLRMVFENITSNSLTWRWQRSGDKGANWTDSWVIYYTRRAPK